MVRTQFVDNELVRFERVEDDERDHAEWILIGEVAAADRGADLTMHLEYTGELWSMNVLGRILDDEVRRSTTALAELLSERAHALNRPSPRRSSRRSRPNVSLSRVGGEDVAELAGGDDGARRASAWRGSAMSVRPRRGG